MSLPEVKDNESPNKASSQSPKLWALAGLHVKCKHAHAKRGMMHGSV